MRLYKCIPNNCHPEVELVFDADSISSYLIVPNGETPKVLANISGTEYVFYSTNLINVYSIAYELNALWTNRENAEFRYFEKL